MATAGPVPGPITEHSHCPNCAVFCPDVQVARQFTRHLLKLPGEHDVRWYTSWEQALAVVQLAGLDRVTICAAGQHMTLWLPTKEI